MGHPNPDLVWDTINAHQRSAALKAGVELGIFDALGEGPQSAATLAEKAGAPERGIRILCDFLTISGLIEKVDGQYGVIVVLANPEVADKLGVVFLPSIPLFAISRWS